MAVQMTFVKHSAIKQYFTADHNGINYIVKKSMFGWHATFGDPEGILRYEPVDQLLYDNRGQAEYACNLHANGGL